MDIEKCIISKVIDEGLYSEAIDQNLLSGLFDGEGRKVWDWITRYYADYGQTPGRDALKSSFPNYELIPTSDNLAFYGDKLREKFAYNSAQDAAQRAIDFLKGGRPYKAIDAMREAVGTVDDLASQTRDIDWTKNPMERYEQYLEMKKLGGIDGHKTPFRKLNEITQGIHDEELILIVARAGVGKTWMEVLLAHHHWSQGGSPLLFSKEMAANQIARRLDSVHAKLPYQNLRAGKLTADDEMRWQEMLSEFSADQSFPIVGDESGGVAHVAAKIERYRPTQVYIDGYYLLEDDRRSESQWMRMANISRDLKRLAKRKRLPIIVSSQLNSDDDLAFYKGIEQDFDLILQLMQTEDQRLAGEMTMHIRKQREGEAKIDIPLIWNHDAMIFDERDKLFGSPPEEDYDDDDPKDF